MKTKLSPNLTAIMCDGMGWFAEIDYKRMLLTYDKIYYLLPREVVKFKDERGKTFSLYFPNSLRDDPAFEVYHFVPDDKERQLIFEAAGADLSNPDFVNIIDTIPEIDQRYTWSVVNVDGDLGGGDSIRLPSDQARLSHAILMNKFLLAASSLGCIPITGKPYIHGLISEKYRYCVENLRSRRPDLLPSTLREKTVKTNPVIDQLVTSLVADEELHRRTEVEIIRFKQRNAELFQRYSYMVRGLVDKVSALPFSDDFEAEVQELIQTDAWKEKDDIESELRSAWNKLFKSALKSAVSGLIGVGVAPFLSLGAVTLASVVAASTAAAPWVVSELIDLLEARKKAGGHGLYYLLKFAG